MTCSLGPALGKPVEDWKNAMGGYDYDNNGRIEWGEFSTVLQDLKGLQQQGNWADAWNGMRALYEMALNTRDGVGQFGKKAVDFSQFQQYLTPAPFFNFERDRAMAAAQPEGAPIILENRQNSDETCYMNDQINRLVQGLVG